MHLTVRHCVFLSGQKGQLMNLNGDAQVDGGLGIKIDSLTGESKLILVLFIKKKKNSVICIMDITVLLG